MKNKPKKVYLVIIRRFIKLFAYINTPLYMNLYLKYLKRLGMKFSGRPLYIASSAIFDGSDYALIQLGEHSSISADVMFLTHDFSANTVYPGLPLKNIREIEAEFQRNGLLTLKKIVVGNNTFIGARSFLLPGTEIGDNCLIGAGSVVRGKIPDNSIVVGNPAIVVKKTSDWLERRACENG